MQVRQEVYDAYWRFCAERQAIFWRRLSGEEPPFTPDPILQNYKFCNVYRASDRVSQFLIREVIYAKKYSPLDTLFRIFLFRLLNRAETWQLLEKKIGEISLAEFSPERFSWALEEIKKEAGVVYGNAFILCASPAFGFAKKHQNQLALLEEVFLKSASGEELLQAPTLAALFYSLRKLPLIGDFMAYQIAIDFNYSEVFDFSENDFTIAGPGAKRGIAKCFIDTEEATSSEVIKYMVERQDEEFSRLGLSFKRIGSRPLQAIDCQGLFCETDKYSRVRFPELASNRVRIKSSFQASRQPLELFYPPKWKVSL